MMVKQYLRILMALIGLAGLGMAANGQTLGRIQVTIPTEFVVGGKVLPAGTYRVHRVNDSFERALVLSNDENGATAFVLVNSVQNRHDDNPAVTFELAGDKLFLSKIQTEDRTFLIPVSRSAILEATTLSQTIHKPAQKAPVVGN
jgi:hypothetical protein